MSDTPTYDPNVTLIYEDYKEPLRKVEKGYGYMGTLALTEDRTLVQCHICGNLFQSLGHHLRTHGTNARDYKKEFGLSLSTALIGEAVREHMQENVVGQFKGKGLPKHLEGFNERRKRGELKVKTHKLSLEWRNKRGLCPDQVLEKILDLKEILGRVPSDDEFRAHYKGRYYGSLIHQHGSWLKALKKLGLQSRDELRRVNREKLIEDLVEFKERYDRIPMTSDFNRGLLRDKGVYIRQFGTLNNARIEAGMNAVIAMPFNQVIEVTPEQYMKYLDGHKLPQLSKATHGQRMRRMKARTTARTAA